MLPKAVLSWIGHVVGIAAVIASPIAARAAQPESAPAGHHASRGSRARAHDGTPKRAQKRATRKAELARTEAKRVRKEKEDVEVPEVQAEPVSNKRPPKPSLTPLPTVAAVTAAPLVEPIATTTTTTTTTTRKTFSAKMFDVAHAPEPSRTPMVTVSTRESHVSHDGPATAPAKKDKHAKAVCLHAPIDVMRGTEVEAFPLTKCDGTVAPLAVEELSILVRPGSAAKPALPIAELAKKSGDEVAPGIRRIDGHLVERLQLVVDHFAKPAKTSRMFVVSGYRPSSKGSFHASGRAIDFRIDGVENTDLVAFCKTLPDTGCGFYPNSSFIHIDVRDTGAGHVAWIDASSPGEKPEYVAAWPLPPKADDDELDPVKLLSKLDELQILPPPSRASHVVKDEDANEKDDDTKADTKNDTKADTKNDTKADTKSDTKADKKPAPASIGKRLDADVKKLEVDTKKLDIDVKKLDADDE